MFAPPAVRWLELLFQGRFSVGLEIQQGEDAISLCHPGSAGRITFDVPEPGFLKPTFDPKYSTWDPVREGWTSSLGRPLPAPGLRERDGALIERVGNDFRVHYDVPGLAFWSLNRIEELADSPTDLHGRFCSGAAHAARHDYLERPWVDEWVEILGQVMTVLWPSVRLSRPTFRTWASHDVDRPSRYGLTTPLELVRRMGGDVLRRRQFADAIRAPWIRASTKSELHPDDPWNTFQWLMDVSEREGLRSTFFFMAGRTDPRFDATYNLEQDAIQHLIRSIHSRGHEIGLHPSYDAYLSEDAVRSEAQRLMSICRRNGVSIDGWGARTHYLRWSRARTPDVLAAAGAAFDSSLTYPDRCGFRSGTCHDFPAFSVAEERILDLRMRPLVVMESTITESMALGVESRAYEKFRELKTACRAVGGVFSLLWHNSSLDSAPARELYAQVIKG